MNFSILTEDFIQQGLYLRNWSLKTIRTYRQGLAAFQTAVLSNDDPLTKTQLQTFVMTLRDRGLTPGGCNMYIRTVNSFLSWLHQEGAMPQPLRIRLLPNPSKPLTTFSDAEVKRILMYRPHGRIQTRTWTLLVCLLDTGMRIDEALRLERQRVDLDALTLTICGKGNRERIVPMSPECRKPLFKLLSKQTGRYAFATHRGERLLYRNAYREIKVLCRRAGVEGAHVYPHNVRHYFAVSYIRNGGDIYRLSRILGHTSISTTQLYLRSMGLEHLQEGHAKYSPLARLT